jgi:splicing factor 3B subunit 3
MLNIVSQMLTYYELDLGLNHVVRKWSEPTDPRANLLVPCKTSLFVAFRETGSNFWHTVPGGQSTNSEHFDGPSGVLVCAENYVIYKHQGVPEHRVPIPRRQHTLSNPERGLIVVGAVMHKMKEHFFVLLQTEEGDLFKVTIDRNEEEVLALKIKYFDTVPVASSLLILKSGFLFVAAEFGNQ